jgi:hypothetical protein
MAIERDGNQHTMGTLGESEAGNAWDWGLTGIHVSLLSRKNTRGQSRSRARTSRSRSSARIVASRLWSLPSQNRTSICCIGPARAFAED